MPDTVPKLQENTPPSQPAALFGGHIRKFLRDRTGFLTEQAKLGDVSLVRVGRQPLFFINHPDLIHDMLVVNADKFIKGRALQRSKVLLGNGLLTSEGEFHLRQRRMIQPAFHRAAHHRRLRDPKGSDRARQSVYHSSRPEVLGKGGRVSPGALGNA